MDPERRRKRNGSSAAPTHTDGDDDDFRSAFDFVRSLAAELSRGRIDLPTFPEVASGVRDALADDELSNTMVARVISSDAGLAANVLALASRAPGEGEAAAPAADLRLAVTRVGPDQVRSAALPYVLAKLRSARSHANIRRELGVLWERSTLVAAIAQALARRTGAAAPDVALLAGLLHNVGSVYLVARAERHPQLFRNAAVREALLREWQSAIGKAIAQNWGLPDEIADAIGQQDQVDRHDAAARDLTDVLCVAVRAALPAAEVGGARSALESLPQFRRLDLDRESLRQALDDAAHEILRLRAALGRC